MHILVTGAAGFIGSHLADALVARGETVLALDNLSFGRREHLPTGVTFLHCDLGSVDEDYLSEQIREFDPDYVAVFGADHIYKMDISQMLDLHIEHGAAATIGCLPVPQAEASSFGNTLSRKNSAAVAFARSCVKLLESIGYQLTYKELPDWGHAYPYSINETIVMPWFESLPARQ